MKVVSVHDRESVFRGRVAVPDSWQAGGPDIGEPVLLLPLDESRFAGSGFMPNITVSCTRASSQPSATAPDHSPDLASEGPADGRAAPAVLAGDRVDDDGSGSSRSVTLSVSSIVDTTVVQLRAVWQRGEGTLEVDCSAGTWQWAEVEAAFDEVIAGTTFVDEELR